MASDCTDVDVLVVGAGPVGTTLALELALHKVSFRIIDRAPVRNDKSRSLVVQPRTLELLNRHGAADKIIPRGSTVRGASLYVGRGLAAQIDLDDLGTTNTEFLLPLSISQVETENFLDECLDRYGFSVERPVTATRVSQDAGGVTTTLEMPDGRKEAVRSKYVVGCDGAHSMVRRAARNVVFDGAAYPQDFLLCDARLRDSQLPRGRLSLHLGRHGVLAVIPIHGNIVRVIASGTQILGSDEPTLELFQDYFASKTPPGSGTLQDPIWLSRFRLHHRCATSYRDGRLFLAGDAAHIHSPAGGQGMNTGIQDSINLGWKLALALRLQSQAQAAAGAGQDAGAARARAEAEAEALLDTYSAERRPVGLDILRGTDRLFTIVTSTNLFVSTLRDLFVRYVLPWLASSTRRRRVFFHFLSQFGVSYRRCSNNSPVVGTASGFRGPVLGGDRLPDGPVAHAASGQRTSLQRLCVGAPHHLLLFAGPGGDDGGGGGGGPSSLLLPRELKTAGERVAAAYARKNEVRVHYIAGDDGRVADDAAEWYADWYVDAGGALHREFGFASPGYVFVRPDGYVGHIGPLSKLDELAAFLDG